jgi:hypothetical protein
MLIQIVNGQYVEGFYIYSIKVNSNGVYKMLTAIHGGGASACTITQLERNTVYDFFLIPFYKSIEGKPSNLIQTATLEDGKDVQYDDYYYDYGNNTKISPIHSYAI